MSDRLVHKYGQYNLYDFSFMDDFIPIREYEKIGNMSNLTYQDKNDFYCYSENKVYTEKELFNKFDIDKIIEEEKMTKSDYENAIDCIRQSIIHLEDGGCWLNRKHKDRRRIHEITNEMSLLMEEYEIESKKL